MRSCVQGFAGRGGVNRHHVPGNKRRIPDWRLKQDAEGNLYGTSESGGNPVGSAGTVFEITPSGQDGILYSFENYQVQNGYMPEAGLVADSNGNLYGTTYQGGDGSEPAGTIFRISATGQYTVLYSFQGSPDGAFPASGLIRDGIGNLYGNTQEGGSANQGTIFKLDPNGNETVLHSFTYTGSNGSGPSNSSLTVDSGVTSMEWLRTVAVLALVSFLN